MSDCQSYGITMSKQPTKADEQETTLVKAGALWTGRGKVAFTGVVEHDLKVGDKILLFPNNKDGNTKRPDFRIVVVHAVE